MSRFAKVSIPQAVGTVATGGKEKQYEKSIVSIPQAVGTVATGSKKSKGFLRLRVSIPQAVGTVATKDELVLGMGFQAFQYRKR